MAGSMDPFGPLLDRLRAPQPSIQRFSVIYIFQKLQSSSSYLNCDLSAGRPIISRCLSSTYPAVIDQSVREFCRLVMDSKIDIHCGLLELQSALEGTSSQFVQLFVKAIGLIVRFGFKMNPASFRFTSVGNHPLVKVVARGPVVHTELVNQVLLFIAEDKKVGIAEICEFLRPFFSYVVLKVSSDPFSFQLARHLVASVASLCCLHPLDALPIYKLLLQLLKYFPLNETQAYKNFILLAEYVVDSYVSILNLLVRSDSVLINETQIFSLELLETILFSHSNLCIDGCQDAAIELSKHLLVAQKSLNLPFTKGLSTILLPLFVILTKSELEHEQLSILRLILFFLKWKEESECEIEPGDRFNLEFLLVFSAINLVSSSSKPVKQAATELLTMLGNLSVSLSMTPEKAFSSSYEFRGIGQVEFAISKMLSNLWCKDIFSSSGTFLQKFYPMNTSYLKATSGGRESWASHLKEIFSRIIERRRSHLPDSNLRDIIFSELAIFLGAIACGLLSHRSKNIIAIDLLTAVATVEPKLSVTLLLTVLFYVKIFSNKDTGHYNTLLELLNILPLLVSQSVMVPLVVQTILPMLQKDAKPGLYAMAVRLLYKTWEINDRTFDNLQVVLGPQRLTNFSSNRIVRISIAASLRDICRCNPDRGVDLILSVSACIESRDSTIQALGCQSLAYLCYADVIDFYTAWDVVAKHAQNYSSDSVLSHSLCMLLRWGAMDAEAYADASDDVLHILRDICTIKGDTVACAKARACAFDALSHFEVSLLEKCLPEFKIWIAQLVVSETSQIVLKAMEAFAINIMIHEHNNRKRGLKAKRVAGNKIEKLLEVIPDVIFPSGMCARVSPGAALLCLPFTRHCAIMQGLKKLQDAVSSYENALFEITSSFQMSRNVLVALLSLESWKPFMRGWLKARTMYLDAKEPSSIRDRTCSAADGILKRLMQAAEESVPRAPENIALALGGLCVVLPPSAHPFKTTISLFLFNWLLQYEHEHRQWSSAVSLGIVSCCLHVTDRTQKFEIIDRLIQVMRYSRSVFVKGCCGLALGYCCQDLLTAVDDAGKYEMDQEVYNSQEFAQLGEIIRIQCQVLHGFAQPCCDLLKVLHAHFPCDLHDDDVNIDVGILTKTSVDMENELWGVAGLIMGLGSSMRAALRAGLLDIALEVKKLVMSWFPYKEEPVVGSDTLKVKNYGVLSIGSCLALPDIMALCQKMEIITDDELDHIMNGYKHLISELLSARMSGGLNQSLLMAACAGAGNFVAFTLNHGVHALKIEDVKYLLESFHNIYSNPFPPSVHLGAMLGVINALGANAGTLGHTQLLPLTLGDDSAIQESPYILSPLLSILFLEPYLTSLVREIFVISQNSMGQQSQQHAAWAVSFLRYRIHYEGASTENRSLTSDSSSKTIPQGVPEDSLVSMLSLWLQKHSSQMGNVPNASTVATVLRCLSHTPRLPEIEWVAIIRRLMRYGGQVKESKGSTGSNDALGKACLKFSLVHAKSFNSLLLLVDEVSDLLRFPSLEFDLQSFLLSHLADLTKIFSGSRVRKLFSNISYFFSSSFKRHDANHNGLLRRACWKGIYKCLELELELEVSSNTVDYISDIENCMETMFSLLPLPPLQDCTALEWSEMVKCFGMARSSWLSRFLQVSEVILGPEDEKVVRKIQAGARLVAHGSLPLAFLDRVKAYILNSSSEAIWHVLVEVVAALQNTETKAKQQWLVDAVEISCVTSFPSTPLQFVGILAGSQCKYMSLLLLSRNDVLSDLPLTLVSLLHEPSWEVIAETVVSRLLTATQRLHGSVIHGNLSSHGDIDRSEKDSAAFLLNVLHKTCVLLIEHLPFEKRIWLANMELPPFPGTSQQHCLLPT